MSVINSFLSLKSQSAGSGPVQEGTGLTDLLVTAKPTESAGAFGTALGADVPPEA